VFGFLRRGLGGARRCEDENESQGQGCSTGQIRAEGHSQYDAPSRFTKPRSCQSYALGVRAAPLQQPKSRGSARHETIALQRDDVGRTEGRNLGVFVEGHHVDNVDTLTGIDDLHVNGLTRTLSCCGGGLGRLSGFKGATFETFVGSDHAASPHFRNAAPRLRLDGNTSLDRSLTRGLKDRVDLGMVSQLRGCMNLLDPDVTSGFRLEV
jgi:hypothetical protein